MLFHMVTKVAAGGEHLDTVGFPVHHVHPLVGVYGDVVRTYELAGVYAGLAPGEPVLPVGRVDVDASVAVSVRNIDIAVSGHNGGRGGTVEGLSAPLGRRMVALSNLHELLTLWAELLNGVDTVVGHQQRVIVGYVESVGAVAEQPFAEGLQEVALLVEDHDWTLSPGQDVDVVPRVHGYPRTLQEAHARRQLGPALREGIAKCAVSEFLSHLMPPKV